MSEKNHNKFVISIFYNKRSSVVNCIVFNQRVNEAKGRFDARSVLITSIGGSSLLSYVPILNEDSP